MKKIIMLLTLFLMSIASLSDTTKEILTKQKEIDKEIEQDISSTKYTLKDPFIMTNPYGISPLTALVIFDTPEKAKITITVKGKKGAKDLVHDFGVYETEHKIPIYGLFEGDNKVIIKATYSNKKSSVRTIKIEAEKNINGLKKLKVVKNTKNANNGLLLTSAGNNGYATAYDEKGNVRWYLNKKDIGKAAAMNKLPNGHYLVSSGDIAKAPYYTKDLIEIDLFGKIYNVLDCDKLFHHETIQLDNGKYLSLCDTPNKPTLEDGVALLDKDSKIIKFYDLKKIVKLKEYRAPILYETYNYNKDEARAKRDWAHTNAIAYDKTDNSMIISMRNLNALVKINLDTEEIKWILTDPNGLWLTPQLKEKVLIAQGNNFKYFYGQHGVKLLNDGDLIVYDNGCHSSLHRKGIEIPDDSYDPSKNQSRGVEYKISGNKVSQVWEYPLEKYSVNVGDINILGKNHYIICAGGIVTIDGKPTDKNVLAREKDTGKFEAIIYEIKNGKLVYKAATDEKEGSFYRARKIQLY